MKNFSPTLYIEINEINFIFSVGVHNQQNDFEIIYTKVVPIVGFENRRVSDFEKVYNIIEKNIYLIEQKINFTFKELVLILENFQPQFINLTGYKSLNGTQILRENITYIINSLKTSIHQTEPNKTILHIFNSKFNLDNKKIENLPIGLFGDFYSQELSFILVRSSDLKNLNNIFDKCNLKIRKILLKSFINGAMISDDFKKLDTFFYLKCKSDTSKIIYFENDSLKFEQDFNFGTNIIIQDISKITSLKKDTVKIILNETEFFENKNEDDLINNKLFNGERYRKIKKKLIFDIATARIREIFELMIFKNTNLEHQIRTSKNIFFELNNDFKPASLQEMCIKSLESLSSSDIKLIGEISTKSILNTAHKLVHFGWKKEAIPITQSKKSLIRQFFDAIFG